MLVYDKTMLRYLIQSQKIPSHKVGLNDLFNLSSSDLADSKLAALNCLLECVKKYEPRHLEPHFKDIWNSCKQVRYTESRKVLIVYRVSIQVVP